MPKILMCPVCGTSLLEGEICSLDGQIGIEIPICKICNKGQIRTNFDFCPSCGVSREEALGIKKKSFWQKVCEMIENIFC